MYLLWNCHQMNVTGSYRWIDDKSTLVQVMAWGRQATSHYLSQCWPRYLSPYGITRPQWVNSLWLNNDITDLSSALSYVIMVMAKLILNISIDKFEDKHHIYEGPMWLLSAPLIVVKTTVFCLWTCLLYMATCHIVHMSSSVSWFRLVQGDFGALGNKP